MKITEEILEDNPQLVEGCEFSNLSDANEKLEVGDTVWVIVDKFSEPLSVEPAKVVHLGEGIACRLSNGKDLILTKIDHLITIFTDERMAKDFFQMLINLWEIDEKWHSLNNNLWALGDEIGIL